MRRRISMILGLAALALVGPGLVPTAAAGTNATAYSSGSANFVSFHAYGDDLLNCDNKGDGHHAVVRWVDSRKLSRTHTSRVSGYGNCKNALAGVNLAEGSGITFMSCIGEGTGSTVAAPSRRPGPDAHTGRPHLSSHCPKNCGAAPMRVRPPGSCG